MAHSFLYRKNLFHLGFKSRIMKTMLIKLYVSAKAEQMKRACRLFNFYVSWEMGVYTIPYIQKNTLGIFMFLK